ncbi:MAG: tyrosine-type recombinase/integrase [Microthrixaceae bacterium]
MARGSKGETSITYNEARDRYEVKVTIGRTPDGKLKRRTLTGKTRRAVQKKRKALEQAAEEQRSTAPERRTVGQYLTEWLEEVLPDTVAPSTLASYSDVVRLYINPSVGCIALVELTPRDVTGMLRALQRAGKSPNTQRLARSVLRRALRRAEAEGIVVRNAAAIADGPKVGTREGRTLTVEQARKLLVKADTEPLGAAWALAVTVGLRRGEVLGLAWDDLKLDGDLPTVTVRRALKRIPHEGLELSEVKTQGSRRTLRLPAPTVARLKRHREAQELEALVLGKAWPGGVLGADLVFRTPLGTPVDPDNFRRLTYELTEDAIGERWSPHELRHSAASLMLAQGVPLKVISEVLGHSSIRITSDVYAHLLDDATSVAADAMGDLFRD